jgi:predicted PurR-regulated permease PerM
MRKSERKNSGNRDSGFGKYVLFGIILLMIFLSYKVLADYILVLISAFVFAYLVRPIHSFLSKRMNKMLSAWICLVLLFIVLIVPFAFVITQTSMQAYSVINSEDIVNVVDGISSLPFIAQFNIDFVNIFEKIGSLVFSLASEVALKIPKMILSFIVFLFAFIYILYDWDKISVGLRKLIPFKNKEKISKQLDDSTNGIVYGCLIIALLDFIISAIGFYFLGIKFYFVLAFLIAMLAFIPGFGPMVIMLPIVIYFVYLGGWFEIILSVVIWLILSVGVETLLKMKILGEKSNIHPLIMILGIIGGTAIFGLFGFIIGPLLLSYTIKLVQGISENN